MLTYYGGTRVPEIPGPYALDLISDTEKKAIMTIAQAGLAMGRPSLAPPNVPADKVAILRAGFAAPSRIPPISPNARSSGSIAAIRAPARRCWK